MDKRVVFILSHSKNQNAIKRIKEFQAHGIAVVAYGFKREAQANISADGVVMNELGAYDNSKSYRERVPVIYRGIRDIIRKYRHENVLYYLFGLDVAGLFCLQASKPYIYEEEDLIYTYFSRKLVRKFFTLLDRHIVKKSVKTIFTSEGFANFHFGEKWPDNVSIIPNKLQPAVIDYPPIEKHTDMQHLRIAFVGSFRFQSVYNFAKVVLSKYPNYTFHLFGSATNEEDATLFDSLKQYTNCVFHGRFKNPTDLPSVYSQFDLLLSTYDVKYENVKYAEPNKLYEAIYYETPIIVSSNCFLGDKVTKLGVGYALDALNDKEIVSFIDGLTLDSINKKIATIRAIDKNYAIDNNSELIENIKFEIL